MDPIRSRLPVSRVVLFAVLILAGSCLGNDFEEATLGVEKWDDGWLIAIEPGEEFSVDLPGNGISPDSRWNVVGYDAGVIQMEHEEHETAGPASGDPEATEGGEHSEGSPVSHSWYSFTGVATGQTELQFELVADGAVIDIAGYTVEVVDDACAAGTAGVANRCGGDGFAYQPQMLQERSYGEVVALQVGGTIDLVLTANALFPESPWQIVTFDDAVIAVEGPNNLGPARETGDYSATDMDTPHSFLPSWELTIRGVAAGESELTLEVVAGGDRVNLFEVTVEVVTE